MDTLSHSGRTVITHDSGLMILMKSRFRITKDKVDDEFLYLSPNVFTLTPLNFLLSKLPARCFIIANSISSLYNQSSFFGWGSVCYVSPLNYQPNEPLQRIIRGAH
ncbi:hypothetical protein [Undibacterium curvum]|uniref:Uncharacterized protein n=1 Tax=Undibacterium curvum TaxID=2762294 RepID=A0ABR7A0H7_9BURK|nr:hypothetical protein [Undibacterium curvum]MBC3930421.1 hypothetical protein [Undibacterium curvum]